MALPAPQSNKPDLEVIEKTHTAQSPQERMTQLAHQLAKAKQAVDDAKTAYDEAFRSWLENEGKQVTEDRDTYKTELANLEAEARDLVQNHPDEIPEGFFRLDDHTTVEIEDSAVEWLIYNAPFLAKELLIIDTKKLKSFLVNNATGKDERTLVPALAPVNKIVKLGIEKKPKIMWSALPDPHAKTEVVPVKELSQREREVLKWAEEVIDDEDTVIIDTETTGLNTNTAEIIQFAAMDARGNILIDNLLIKPAQPIPKDATRIHGLSDEDVKDAVSFAQAYETIAPVLNGKRVIIYNSGYDWPLIESLVRRNELDTLKPKAVDCAMKKYAQWEGTIGRYGSYKWHKLTDASRQLGIEVKDAHDALGDVRMTWGIIKQLSNYIPF